jgi:hypothetical protein
LVLPEEYDADDSGETTGEVIDLRNLKTGNRVRFADPQPPSQRKSAPKQSAEEKLQSIYELDQSRQIVKNDRNRRSGAPDIGL